MSISTPYSPTFAAPPKPRLRRHHWSRTDTITSVVIFCWALITRFVGLSTAHVHNTPVFDEKHYAPQAWDIVNSWINPLLGGIESNPGYGLVVHPPLAKQLQALGEMIFGYTPLGWRFVAAVFGAVLVVLIMDIARQLSRSTFVASAAGILALFDGVLLITSRYGMLDIFQTFFITAACWALVRDWLQVSSLMTNTGASRLGPRVGYRWWRFTAGIFLGLALSVKWSGLYYMAFFGVVCVILDIRTRHRAGVASPIYGALVRDSFKAFTHLVIVPVLIYVYSWRAWFATETAVYRHAAVDGTIDSNSLLHLLPESVAGWFYYHSSVLKFHASLTTSSGHDHPFDSKPWEWLIGGKPILYYSANDLHCLGTSCTRMIYLFGTPALWWLTVPLLAWALWRWLIQHEWTLALPVTCFLAGIVPWMIGYDRQMYFFYAAPLAPMIIVFAALLLGTILNRYKNKGIWIVCGYLGLVLAQFVYFSPILYGYPVPTTVYNSLMWFDYWR
ncbi:MAG: phospholipid carrier-dependent glycosyltransferase [Corynebacterium sp.]|nr:phospholipid carrier-dependent glycosyltransferase [Corynebacterium sp.]MDO4761812.1 phospholipid carrier-dependent glycosyltransferase [Corynebacterium sp.]